MASIGRRQGSSTYQQQPSSYPSAVVGGVVPGQQPNASVSSFLSASTPIEGGGPGSSPFSSLRKKASIKRVGSSGGEVRQKPSWKELRKKPSSIQSQPQQPQTPAYVHHAPVSHLDPPPHPNPASLPQKYTSQPLRAPGPPLASLYLVAGLPKQTHTWTAADKSSIAGVQHRAGAVGGWWRAEILGSNASTTTAGAAASAVGGGDVVGPRTAPAETEGPEGEEWSQKLSGKALKYSFAREIEIISATLQPPSTVHSFSFTLAPTNNTASISNQQPPANMDSQFVGGKDGSTTYHGVTLTVYSHADKTKTDAIRRTLEAGGSSAARAGDFWLPYALTLVSKFPIYSLMTDYLKISWAKFSKDVASHSRQMTKIIQTPTPRQGERIRLRILSPSAINNPDPAVAEDADPDALEIISELPGHMDLVTGLVSVGWQAWVFFKVLSLDNIITIVEIARSTHGRVIFTSRYPALLGIAVSTLRYICDLRGWEGIAHPIVHARDVSLLVEDGGPFILGLDTECKYISRPGPDVCVVDLDINFVNCTAPPPGAVSTRQARDKIRGKLVRAFGDGSGHYTEHGVVPSEFMEAYPGGRLRPLCETCTGTGMPDALSAERITPPPWWDEVKVMQAFDRMLADKNKKPSFIKRITSSSSDSAGKGGPQKPISPGERLARAAMRRRASQFVDARDDMEGKLGRLSRRLAFLVHESDVWKERFEQFETLTDRLGVEANELRIRIEKEKRESKRLSGVVGQTEKEKDNLRSRLRQTEDARAIALEKMADMQRSLAKIEYERDAMIASIDSQLESHLSTLYRAGSAAHNGGSEPSSRSSSRSSSVRRRTISTTSRRQQATAAAGATPGDASTVASSSAPSSVPAETGGANYDKTALRQVEEERSSRGEATTRKKRFSAMGGDSAGSRASGRVDPLESLDDKISAQTSDVADKVAAIQLKLDLALKSIHRQSMDLVRPSLDGREEDGSQDHHSLSRTASHDQGGNFLNEAAADHVQGQTGTGTGKLHSALAAYSAKQKQQDQDQQKAVPLVSSPPTAWADGVAINMLVPPARPPRRVPRSSTGNDSVHSSATTMVPTVPSSTDGATNGEDSEGFVSADEGGMTPSTTARSRYDSTNSDADVDSDLERTISPVTTDEQHGHYHTHDATLPHVRPPSTTAVGVPHMRVPSSVGGERTSRPRTTDKLVVQLEEVLATATIPSHSHSHSDPIKIQQQEILTPANKVVLVRP